MVYFHIGMLFIFLPFSNRVHWSTILMHWHLILSGYETTGPAGGT